MFTRTTFGIYKFVIISIGNTFLLTQLNYLFMLSIRFTSLFIPLILGLLLILGPSTLLAANESFTSVGNMSTERLGQTATLLQDGKVLIVGGDASANTAPYLNSAEIYDPATGTFTSTGNMTESRSSHTATLLQDGKVLIAGGMDEWGNNHTLITAEIYDPITGTFTSTGNMTEKRNWHRATLLDDGKVLIVGGFNSNIPGGGTYHKSVEIYDPATGTFSSTGNMGTPRIWFALTKLDNGKVLVAGGSDKYAGWTNTAEIYDPATGTFSYSDSLATARWINNGVLLENDSVLYAGGNITGDTLTNSAEIYDIATANMSSTGNVNTKRGGDSQTLLLNGEVLIAGGHDRSNYLNTAEKYDPNTGVFTYTTNTMQTPRYNHQATRLNNGDVLLTGGVSSGDVLLASAEIFSLGNNAPVLDPVGNQTVNENEMLSFTLSATDSDNDSLIFSATNIPTGSTLNPTTGVFSWTPTYDDAGIYTNVEFTVTDDGTPAELDTEIITITVGDVNRAPVLATIGNQTVNENEMLSFTLSATDPDGDSITFSATNTPAGSIFNPVTGVFSWTPTYNDGGNYTDIEFTVTDDGTPIELDMELITITVGDVNRAPVISNIGSQTILETELLTFTLSATDPDGDSITYSATNTPAGSIFNPATGVFSWTPTLSDEGVYIATFIATDNGTPAESAAIDVVITVGDNPTPTEQAEDLVEEVLSLEASTNIENSYLANLKKVAKFIEQGKIQSAINQLNAFINKIDTNLAQGLLTQPMHAELLTAANNLISDLQN